MRMVGPDPELHYSRVINLDPLQDGGIHNWFSVGINSFPERSGHGSMGGTGALAHVMPRGNPEIGLTVVSCTTNESMVADHHRELDIPSHPNTLSNYLQSLLPHLCR